MNFVKYQIFFRIVCFSFPLILVLTALTMIFSHRIAGPIYRFEQTLDKLIQGEDVEYVRLRKSDELKGFADKLNELIRIVKKLKSPQNEDIPPPE